MRMRYKPLRGEKYKTDSLHGIVTILEVIKSTQDGEDHQVKVVNQHDKLEVISIKLLPLIHINTKDYEKIGPILTKNQ